MSEEVKTEEVTTEEKPELSNGEVKSHPLFQKLTEQLSEYQRKEQEARENEERSRKEAELKKAEEEQNWKKLIELREQELEQTKSHYEKKFLDMQLENAISKEFNNSVFIKGAMAGFTGSPDDIAEYVASLREMPENAVFLNTQQTQPNIPSPPNTPKVTGGVINEGKVLAMEKSSDPQERAKARQYLEQMIREGRPVPK